MKAAIRRAVASIAYNLAPRFTTALKYEYSIRRGQTETELALLPLLCDKMRVSLDVGAAHGVYSYHMMKFSSKVIAFEPSPWHCEILARRMPPSVEIHAYALSDVSGTAPLRVPNDDPGRSTIEPENGLPGLGPVTTQTIRVCRLDDVQLPGQVGFIKIDVEGHEIAVLRGGLTVLERDRPQLVVEIEERHRPHSLHETISFLRQLNYRGYFFYGGVLHPIEEFNADLHQQRSMRPYINNFVFVSRDRCGLLTKRLPISAG